MRILDVGLLICVDGDTELASLFQLPQYADVVRDVYRDLAHLIKNVWKAVNVTHRVRLFTGSLLSMYFLVGLLRIVDGSTIRHVRMLNLLLAGCLL